jgi:SAM-dependent methyltransferase
MLLFYNSVIQNEGRNMKLTDLINRKPVAEPWSEGEKIPWNDPDFSGRMLKEHLSQKHDAASRRTTRIKKHVDWINGILLAGSPSHILDLGCGPGLCAARLAALGHAIVGIDFSPASIEYAKNHSPQECSYIFSDIRSADFGTGYDLVMFIFGEFNVFKPADARLILNKAYAALKPGGQLLLEISTFDGVEQMGNMPSTWYSAESGLFSADPHLCLMENFWDEEQSAATQRFYIIDAAKNEVTPYAFTTLAYEEEAIQTLVMETGFTDVRFLPSLTGKTQKDVDELMVVVARK